MTRRPSGLRVLFAVQGEGRGHMTQALAFAGMLRQRGHAVVGAVVGAGRWGDVPEFFRRGLGAPVETVESPGFVVGQTGTIRPAATLWNAVRQSAGVRRSLDRITAAIDRTEPDVVVSFYEALTGAHSLLRGADVPTVAVGHQFMMGHPRYPLQPGQAVQRTALQAYTALVGAGTSARLALSFYDAADSGGATVTPPLLRRSLFALADRPRDGSVLVYLMEPRMAPALAAWSDRRPGVRVHAFAPVEPHAHSPALTFHGLSGRAFLERMAAARGVVCTAGFETVSEAMWLGTPALMVPTPGHYEQRCNAADAVAVGAGVAAETLDLDPLLDYLGHHDPDPGPFRQWVARAEGRAVGAVERAAGVAPVGGDGADGESGDPDVAVAAAQDRTEGRVGVGPTTR